MLSYLAATLPPNTTATARLIALQCALRMNRGRQVHLPKGLLRSMRLDTPRPWHELQQAQWLHILPERTTNEIAAELLDGTLLEQAPARPDRRRAAQWALRASSRTRANGALPRLASRYLAAHTSAEEGIGHSEADTALAALASNGQAADAIIRKPTKISQSVTQPSMTSRVMRTEDADLRRGRLRDAAQTACRHRQSRPHPGAATLKKLIEQLLPLARLHEERSSAYGALAEAVMEFRRELMDRWFVKRDGAATRAGTTRGPQTARSAGRGRSHTQNRVPTRHTQL